MNFLVSPSSRHVFWVGHSETWFVAVQKVFNNPSLVDRLLTLSVSSNYAPDASHETVPIVDGVPAIDVFRILNILENNGFGFMTAPDQKQPYRNIPCPQLDGFYDCLGVWDRASYANHSCLCNVERSFLGDCMIFRAIKDIPKDTEPTLAYVHVDGKYEEVKMALQNYGFRCDCKLCAAENAYDGTRVKLYVEKIEDTYPPELFADLPRFGLIKRHAWLMKAIAMLDRNTALMYAQDVVREHGFKPFLNNAGILIEVDRSNIILTTEIVDAFAFMGVYYRLKRQMALSRLMKKLAREHYVILNGSAVGYELMYELCYQQNGLNTA
ncbi:hypothetical protein E4T42_00568 [Aureobasidium subglaciale]|nr:hypothetical protein E4T42_00568 [Aureobasidium subglaciale]